MEKDFNEFIAKRCEKALEEDEDYMQDEMSGTVDQDELQKKAEVLCYLKGFRDFTKMLGVDADPFSILNGSHGSQNR